MIDETTFRRVADGALDSLFKALTRAGESCEFVADMKKWAVTLELEDPPGKFVVSPNAPVRQIWVSAHSKSFKLDWDDAVGAFTLGGVTLLELMGQHISTQLGEEVVL